MGSPQKPTAEQYAQLEQAGQLQAVAAARTLGVEDGRATVRFDLPRLGDVTGVRGVHLQCHIGTDTISLSRLGARMTGLDFSGASLAVARDLAFDGVFFTGVRTTRVYCRPVCPVRPAQSKNVRFFATAAAAERADGLWVRRQP